MDRLYRYYEMYPGAIVLLLVFHWAGAQEADPRAIVRSARQAVEHDSVVAARARWEAALSRDPADRGAALGLASLAQLTYHHDEAQRRFVALMTRPGGRSDAIAITAKLQAAWDFDEQGFVEKSDTLFRQARSEAHSSGDSALEAEALVGLSLLRASQFGAPLGIALLDSAARLLPAGEYELGALLAARRALLYAVTQRNAGPEALAGVALARRAGAPRLEAACLQALALDEKLRGRADSSLDMLTHVEALERATHDDVHLATALARHADLYHDRGDLGLFREYVLSARERALTSGNLYVAASANIGLALVAIQLHDDATAAQYLTQAAALNDSLGDRSGKAEVLAYDALRLADAGDFARARAQMEASRAFRRSISDPDEFEVGRDLVYVDIAGSDLQAAAAALRDAEDAARRYRLSSATSFDRERGRLALAMRNPRDAIVILSRALDHADTAAHFGRYGLRTLLAQAYVGAGDLTTAARELSSAEDELDTWRAALTDSALRPFVFQVSSQEIDDRSAGPASVLSAMARGGMAAEAFALAERRRARELADRLVRLDALREHPTATSVNDSLLQSGRRAATLTSQRVVADSVAGWLPAHTALLEFITGAHGVSTTLLVVPHRADAGAGSGLHALSLRSADSLAPDIDRFVALLESGEEAVPLARTLGAALLDSAVAELGPDISRLIIVPDGPLHRLPFDALRLTDHRPVAAHYAVSLAPSAVVWDALRKRAPAAAPDPSTIRLLVLANPVFASASMSSTAAATGPGLPGSIGTPLRQVSPPDGLSDVYRGAFDSAGGLPALPASAREARLVAAFAPQADVRLGGDATAAYLEHTPLTGFAVIHIATHALVDERSIARTALALAPGGGESGFVTPSDLAALKLRTDLVVLSACRTAGGVVIDGEGVQGLTGPLLAAGAQSVLATQWRVRDNAVLPLIEHFYNALASGLPVADALQAAKRDAITRGLPASDWAAFIVVGDPMTRIPLTQPGPLRLFLARVGAMPIIGIAAVGLVLLLLVASLMTRGRIASALPRDHEARTSSAG